MNPLTFLGEQLEAWRAAGTYQPLRVLESHPIRLQTLQADSDRHRVALLKNELALCFTFSIIAARKYETESHEAAEKSMANAEKAYETVIQFLSDPKPSKYLTKETIQEFTAELERLRDRLDGLQRFRK